MEYESGLEITALPVSKFSHEVASGHCTEEMSNEPEPPEEEWGDIMNGHHPPLDNSYSQGKSPALNPYYFPDLGRPSAPKKKSFQNPASFELDENSSWYEDSWTENQQPVVRFQCLKCGESGFETLPYLKNHHKHCFRLRKVLPGNNRNRRKVYFCNSCGTYHSGCDLYLHTIQVHQRHVCLFCMSVFMRADKLSYHLRTRHRLPNTTYSSQADFFSHFSKGCMLSCCSCSRLFSETDNFYGHECRRPKNKSAKSSGENLNALPESNHKNSNSASHQSANFTLPQLKDVTIIPINKQGGKKENQDGSRRAPLLRIKLNLPKKSKKKSKAPPEPPPPPPPPEPEPQPFVEEMEDIPDAILPPRLNGESSIFDSDVSKNEESDWTQQSELPFMDPYLPEAEPEPEPEEVKELPPAEDEIQLAGEDAPLIDLYIDKPLEELQIREVLKQAITEACSTCNYCSHAVKIAVNGKQLALHLLSQHRFQLTLDKEQLPLESFMELAKSRLTELEPCYFNCDSYDSSAIPDEPPVFMKHYECFQCRYVTILHKELYVHNRKMHQKNCLVCTMCKTNFFNYSELLCHLCPGVYMDNHSTKFRCCFCTVDNLPSSFRLMVHLRKCHLSCEVCLEATADQSKLSVHVWKHKLNHYCHKCCIAYRNKTDMTRHLFWKHGTESVTCKKCMQKKWPYVYHFCVPPSQFSCEECGSTFGRAVALKVHKRLHSNELLYPCGECNESFISRKLLARHDTTVHNPPPPPPPEEAKDDQDVDVDVMADDGESMSEALSKVEPPPEVPEVKVDVPEKKTTPKRDVLDLPPLNLSSESESESDAEDSAPKPAEVVPVDKEAAPVSETSEEPTVPPVAAPSDSVWDNFKDQNEKVKEEEKVVEEVKPVEVEAVEEKPPPTPPPPTLPPEELAELVNFDHDYFNIPAHAPGEEPVDEPPMPVIDDFQIPGDTILASFTEGIQLSPPRFFKKKRRNDSSSSDSSSSSSDSDSSSCSCSSSNCSCGSGSSSSGSSSSSSSDSESDTEKKARKLKKKLKKRAKAEQSLTNGLDDHEVKDEEPIDLGPPVLYFHESDLDTNESASDDEDFYDQQPRKPGVARPSTLSSIFSPSITPAPTPPPSLVNGVAGNNTNSDSALPHKPKAKKKKRQHHESPSEPPKKKRKDHWSPDAIYESNLRFFLQNQKKKPHTRTAADILGTEVVDGSRLSKRVRVPKKFYGDSGEEESSQHMFSPMMMTPVTPVVKPAKKKSRSSSVVSGSATSTPVRPLSPREMTESERRLTSVINFVAQGYDGKTADDLPYRGRPKLVLTLSTGSFSRYSQDLPPSESSSEEEYDSDGGEAEPEPVVVHASPIQEAIETFTRAHPSELQQLDCKLYCYCKCPYDEVSEMIGCDNSNCPIEWFHFDCVGISVPPTGTWYCPECLKKQALAAT